MVRQALLISGLMVTASAVSVAITPSRHLASHAESIHLEALVPQQFGDWHMDMRSIGVVNPQTEEFLATIYSQTLSRTYVNTSGRRIMLSLAYGADQSHDNQIHKPEVCYPAQGFQIGERYKDQIVFENTALPVMRLTTRLGSRYEPVTYWIRVGDRLVRGAIEQNLTRISYGVRGSIPDGILFRVSEVNGDSEASFRLQDRFVGDLLKAVSEQSRVLLVGSVVQAESQPSVQRD